MTRILKIICLGLAAVMLVQVSRLSTAKDPLAQLNLPALTAAKPSDSKPADPEAKTEKKATNVVAQPNPGAAKKETTVSPVMQARIERIVQSEILGPVMRPLPMALLGIAGKDAFFRAPNGQTGLIREGEELGGVKLLRLGTNRVLIEHEGQKKEMMIFSGFGSETLLLKGKETP
jgi:hypothetical protein